MQWLALVAGIASMKAAVERGDLDEAARQGQMAGPAIVEQALHSNDRATVLAGILAAPEVEDRAELLPALAQIAAGPDRRTAIPAARAARAIAKAFVPVDDIANEEIATWRAAFVALAMREDRWIEVRTTSLEVAAALADPDQLGFDLAAMMKLVDPAMRSTAVALVPSPAPESARAILATAIANDTDERVAIGAAQASCPMKLDDAAKKRLEKLVTGAHPAAMVRDAKRCLSVR